jgi:outer membrane protein OmpA-like peptidoglycan-associated protein
MKTLLAPLGFASLLLLSAAPVRAQVPDEEPMPPAFGDLKAPAATATSHASAPAESGPSSDDVIGPGSPDSFLPSLMGPVGLYHMSTAEVGPRNHVRFALHGEYFSASDFLIKGDTNSRIDGDFTFGYTPNKYIELFGALLSSSNRNHRASEDGRRDPELIKSFGDLVLGSKIVTPLGRGMSAGFELGLRFLSSISDLSFSPDSTSMWVGPLFTLDLRPVSDIPLRFHVNANYYLDNSRNLFDFSNDILATREVAMYAYGIQGSRLRFALGIDAPLEKVMPNFPLQPFGEYHLEVVTDDAQGVFVGTSCAMPDNRDQQWLTFGLRARVYRGVTVDAGVDARVRSTSCAYSPPLAPYDVVFGLSYPLDVEAFRRPVVVTRTIEKQLPAPIAEEGHIAGAVTSAKDGKPIPGAIVAVAGRPRSRVATDPDGSFITAPLPPGPAELEVTAPNFESNKVTAAVMVGAKPVELNVTLTPKTPTGNVRGKITDAQGQPVQAALRFGGAEAFEAKSDAGGLFSAALPVGPYRVTAEAPGFPSKEVALDITAGQDQKLDILLRTPNPDITLAGDTVTLRQPITFKSGTPKLDPKVQGELDGVVELLSDHPEIRTLRVEAHWDASAGKGAKALTDKQAAAIKDYLVKKGASEGRVEAVGMGSEKPLVPNIGPANKAKNRRVELKTTR